MLHFAKQLFEELYWRLAELDDTPEATEVAPPNRAPMIQAAIDDLSERLRTHVFETEAEEAEFFKLGLPPLLALASYYLTRYRLELSRQRFHPSAAKRQVFLLIDEMNRFFREHAAFVDYCLAGRTDRDSYYFLRNSPANEKTIDMLTILVDPEISTVHSVRAAMVISYIWLMCDLQEPHPENFRRRRLPRSENSLQWTDSSAGLVEMIYAFYAKGSFNNGNATIREIAEYFEDVFSVHLGNYYRVFQEILCRKKGLTQFMNRLTDRLDEFTNGEG
jgi:hypothetical protein